MPFRPAPRTAFRIIKTRFREPFLFAGIYREAPPAVDAFGLDRFQGGADTGGRNAQPRPLPQKEALRGRWVERFKGGLEEQPLIEFKVRFGPEMGYPPAAGDHAVYRLNRAFAAMTNPSPVDKMLIEDEDLPGVRYAAHLPGVPGNRRETADIGDYHRNVDIIRIRIVAGDGTAQDDLLHLRYLCGFLRELPGRVPESFVPVITFHLHIIVILYVFANQCKCLRRMRSYTLHTTAAGCIVADFGENGFASHKRPSQ